MDNPIEQSYGNIEQSDEKIKNPRIREIDQQIEEKYTKEQLLEKINKLENMIKQLTKQ